MSLGALTDLLESISPEAAREFGLMNQLFFQDKGSAAVKARTFLELVINKVLELEKDNINMPSIVYAKLVDKISYLVAEGFVGQDIQLAMNSVRKIGNKAAHDGSDITYPDVFSAHKNAHSVGVWFLELYSKQYFEAPKYEEPKPQSDLNASEIESMVKSYLKENGLIRDQKTEATDKEINQEEISILNKDLPKGELFNPGVKAPSGVFERSCRISRILLLLQRLSSCKAWTTSTGREDARAKTCSAGFQFIIYLRKCRRWQIPSACLLALASS